MSQGIRIRDLDGGFVNFDLAVLLKQFDGSALHWSILELEATGDLGENKHLADVVNQVRTSKCGLQVSWKELVDLASHLHQVIWGFVIGSQDPEALERYASEAEVSKNCDIVIDVFDTTYCDVYARDQGLLDRISAGFPNSQPIEGTH